MAKTTLDRLTEMYQHMNAHGYRGDVLTVATEYIESLEKEHDFLIDQIEMKSRKSLLSRIAGHIFRYRNINAL